MSAEISKEKGDIDKMEFMATAPEDSIKIIEKAGNVEEKQAATAARKIHWLLIKDEKFLGK